LDNTPFKKQILPTIHPSGREGPDTPKG